MVCAVRNDGSAGWTRKVPGAGLPRIALGPDGSVYVATDGLYVISSDGRLVARYRDVVPVSAPVVAEGAVYVASGDHLLCLVPWPDATPDARETVEVVDVWETERGGLFRSYSSWSAADVGSIGPSAVVWSVGIGTLREIAPPAVTGEGTVYVGGVRRADRAWEVAHLSAVDRAGTRRWSVELPRLVSGPAAAPDGSAVVSTFEGMYAYNPDGARKWFTRSGSSTSVPVIDRDGVIYCRRKRDLMAIDSTGHVKWQTPMRGGPCMESGLAVDGDGRVYASDDFTAWAFEPDGRPIWVYDHCRRGFSPMNFPIPGGSVALGPDGTLYVRSGFDTLLAFSAKEPPTPDPVPPGGWPPVVAGKHVSNVTWGGHQLQEPPRAKAVGPVSPHQKWEYTPPGPWIPRLVPEARWGPTPGHDGRVRLFYPDPVPTLLAVNPDGTVAWRVTEWPEGQRWQNAKAWSPWDDIVRLSVGNARCFIDAEGTILPPETVEEREDEQNEWPYRDARELRNVRPKKSTGATRTLTALTGDGSALWSLPVSYFERALGHFTPEGSYWLITGQDLIGIGPDGREEWVYRVGTEPLWLALVDAAGALYALGDRGLYSFGPDGRLRWIVPPTGDGYAYSNRSRLVLADDGTLYVYGGSGPVTAFGQ